MVSVFHLSVSKIVKNRMDLNSSEIATILQDQRKA